MAVITAIFCFVLKGLLFSYQEENDIIDTMNPKRK